MTYCYSPPHRSSPRSHLSCHRSTLRTHNSYSDTKMFHYVFHRKMELQLNRSNFEKNLSKFILKSEVYDRNDDNSFKEYALNN